MLRCTFCKKVIPYPEAVYVIVCLGTNEAFCDGECYRKQLEKEGGEFFPFCDAAERDYIRSLYHCLREESDGSINPSHGQCGGCAYYRECPDPVVKRMRE